MKLKPHIIDLDDDISIEVPEVGAFAWVDGANGMFQALRYKFKEAPSSRRRDAFSFSFPFNGLGARRRGRTNFWFQFRSWLWPWG